MWSIKGNICRQVKTWAIPCLFLCASNELTADRVFEIDSLNQEEIKIVNIAAASVNEDLDRLALHINNGLDEGLSINEVKEIFIHLSAYTGFPRSLNGLETLMEVLSERTKRGIEDKPGKEASPYPNYESKYKFGEDNLTKLIGRSYNSAINDFAPAIDKFLKEHLFADIFGRDVLDFKTRELITVAALASMKGTQKQLRSHMNVAMYNGVTTDQLMHLINLVYKNVGFQYGEIAQKTLSSIIALTPNAPGGIEKDKIDIALSNFYAKGQKVSSKNFSGPVWVNQIIAPDSIFNLSMATVTFPSTVRTNWHKHASGQILVITEGIAYYQEKGKSKQLLSKGQIIECPPGTLHWHGAAPGEIMTHLAISPNFVDDNVTWSDSVTEEEYNK
ncbi:MAG: carboxymuconolactone decarboxylase family protein [Saprospiraceae bacterium]|nr:carboxymuconolactone decarboxylase family protein [Saprospiraceae bacterium]